MEIGNKVIAKPQLKGEITWMCNHSHHRDNKCVDVQLTSNLRYTLKFTEHDLKLDQIG